MLFKLPQLLVACGIAVSSLGNSLAQSFDWPTNTPENVGMNSEYIDAAIEQIESGQFGNTRSLVIIKDGQLITEKYFGNLGEKRPVYSVTKSVGSALLGIAQYNGAQIDLNDSIMDYLPQYSDIPNIAQANSINLHHLLSQRHGYQWDEWSTSFGNPNNPMFQFIRTNDWYKFAVSANITELPDQNFTYSTGHSSLMSPILNNRTDRDIYEFAVSELFQPLGITDTHWELVDGGASQGQGITNFPFGLEPLGYGLWLKPIDLAKIGELYRLNGIWQNNRLLSEDWINKSVQRYSDGQSDPDVFSEYGGYGYQWWITQITDANDRPTDMYYANGYGGQFIFVIPQYDAVIVTTANDFFYNGPNIGSVLQENLLLAFNTTEGTTIPMTTDHNGSWYFPEHNGQGINFEVLNGGNKIAGFWYTYDSEGGKQRWFTLQGDIIDGVANFNIYSTSGGVFVNPQPAEVIQWGEGTIEIFDCLSGHFTFISNDENSNENISDEFPLTRITASVGSCLENNKSQQELGYELR